MRAVQSDCQLPPFRAMEKTYPSSTSSSHYSSPQRERDRPYPQPYHRTTPSPVNSQEYDPSRPNARSRCVYAVPDRPSHTVADDEGRRHAAREEALARTLARARGESYATSAVSSGGSLRGAERVDRGIRNDARPITRRSLSVFNAPTATYMWPTFKAASQMGERPVIYVHYHHGRRSALANSDHAQSDDELYAPHATCYDTGERSPPYSSSSDPGPVREITEPFNNMGLAGRDNLRSDSSHSSYSSYSQSAGSSPWFERSDRDGSDSAYEDPYSDRSFNSSGRDVEDDVQGPLEEQEGSTRTASSACEHSEYDPDRWHEYTVFDTEANQFRCTWVNYEGIPASCTYTSRKHLVKRHIQTHHMKIKKWKCEYCGKAFPQKGSLDNHRHTHTGAKPHACRFGCGESFNDPARRHRHMVEKHGYKPRRSNKKQAEGVPGEVSRLAAGYESVQPWRLIEHRGRA
ncbi:hypothetical protein OE88DRAFT_649357 [Heliocybe sulcata]|uniref:C2H2-type domain-containing protein n=1 Tax=Heliocybe sulcata TaxID=5364 RepID=A0A5C3NE97_9AGAM|nr:hypothetical protein OE88DRAFT_649357 [Heliocybe sulcata]